MIPLLSILKKDRLLEGASEENDKIARLSNFLNRLYSCSSQIQQIENGTDILIQRITNLISIDEGYRSRDKKIVYDGSLGSR